MLQLRMLTRHLDLKQAQYKARIHQLSTECYVMIETHDWETIHSVVSKLYLSECLNVSIIMSNFLIVNYLNKIDNQS